MKRPSLLASALLAALLLGVPAESRAFCGFFGGGFSFGFGFGSNWWGGPGWWGPGSWYGPYSAYHYPWYGGYPYWASYYGLSPYPVVVPQLVTLGPAIASSQDK